MPLRLVELTIPSGEVDALSSVVGDIPVVHMWTTAAAQATGVVHILVDARHTEALSDGLVQHFGSRDAFRVTLLPVEATLPAVEEPPEPETAAGEGEEANRRAAQRISREELYEDVAQASKLTPVYVIMVALSTVVAAVGLLRGDVAIIIGAMVIAPLLGPNIALSLASTLGDPDLARRSLKAIAAGVAVAAALSVLLGTIVTVDPTAPELASRTQADLGDVLLALAAGAAGALAFTSGVPAVVVGVMVAVALLPPLVVAGLLAGAGYGVSALGALLLVVANVTCLNLAAVGTFFLQKIRPRTWWEAERARRSTRIAVVIWIAMLLVLLGLMLAIGV